LPPCQRLQGATIAAVSTRGTTRKSKHHRPAARFGAQALTWVAAAQGGVVIVRHWRALSAKERARLAQLARKSRGRPRSLSLKERLELRRLVGKLDLEGLGRELLALTGRRGVGRRRSRFRT
jgi:hypothetical protein